jgi:hypothetical protein
MCFVCDHDHVARSHMIELPQHSIITNLNVKKEVKFLDTLVNICGDHYSEVVDICLYGTNLIAISLEHNLAQGWIEPLVENA